MIGDMIQRVSRNFIERFIREKKLGNVAEFLRYLAWPAGLKVFVTSARKHGYKVSAPHGSNLHLLLHGSQGCPKILMPSRSEKFVYATDDPNYAIFLAVIKLVNARASVVSRRSHTTLAVDIAFVNGPSRLRDGWVHLVSGKGFRKTSNREYVSRGPVEVLFAIPVKPLDVMTPVVVTLGAVNRSYPHREALTKALVLGYKGASQGEFTF